MVVKADDLLHDESDITEFDYLRAQVKVLTEQVELMAKIIIQNYLGYVTTDTPSICIED